MSRQRTSVAQANTMTWLCQTLLGFKRNAYVCAAKRAYTPGAARLSVPGDLLRHPFVILSASTLPTPDEVNLLFAQYPIRCVIAQCADQIAVYSAGAWQVYTKDALQQTWGYSEVDDAKRLQLLQQWSHQALPLCADHDYMLLTLQTAYATLTEAKLTRAQTLQSISCLMLGLAGGEPIAAGVWQQPARLGATINARAAAILASGNLAHLPVQLDATTWLRLAYLLAPIDWSAVQWDLLGPLYSYTLSTAQRRGAGIFYTPPELVDQVLDTAGVLSNLPVAGSILEPCAGSGAFVVRLLARVRMAAGSDNAKHQVQQVLQQLTAIEPDAGACQLLRYNVAMQWACACGQQPEPLPAWDLQQCDALKCYSPFATDSEPAVQKKQLTLDMSGETAALEETNCKTKTDYAYVIGNPPYVGESGHRKLFAQYRNHPFWQQYSESKMDFLQYFIVLGLTKIQAHPQGRLCFLTSAYWLTANGAAHLRHVVLDQAQVQSVTYIQGEQSRFKDAPGHHSVITLLVRCVNPQVRDAHRVLVQEFATVAATAPTAGFSPDKAVNPLQQVASHWFAEPQAALRGKPWFLQVTEQDLDVLQVLERHPCLQESFAAKQGVVPGTQRVGQAELRLLGPEWVAQKQIHAGEGVFVLTSEELATLKVPAAEARFVRPFVKNSSIQPFGIVRDTPLWLLYLRHDQVRVEECPVLTQHLARFRPLLERKREYRKGVRDWFHMQWPREEQLFCGEKILTAQRGRRPAFAWSDQELFAATDVYLIVPRTLQSSQLNLLALTGILNSSLGWFWFAHRTKAKGEQREFFSHALEQFPLPVAKATDTNSTEKTYAHLTGLVRQLHTTSATPAQRALWLAQIDALVFGLYGISEEHMRQIKTWLEK